MTGADIKADNGSGYSLSQWNPKRTFRDNVLYDVYYNGAGCDCSTITEIKRNPKQEF